MKPLPINPRTPDLARLDLQRFAADAGHLQGELPHSRLPRLREALFDDAGAAPQGRPVQWSAQGGQQSVAGVGVQPWLQLQAQAEVTLQCQRCLRALAVPLSVDRRFRFVESDAQADAEDLDSEDEVLTLPAALNLPALIEDELLLALPLVPRHELCEPPAPLHDDSPLEDEAEPERPHPFAALEALKRGPSGRH